MTREDIIRFGEQADEVADRKIKMRGEYHPDWHEVRDQKFAALVAAAAKAEEREECMRICNATEDAFLETLAEDGDLRRNKRAQGGAIAASDIADAIRARREEPKRHPGYIMGEHWLQAAYTRICTGETEAEVMSDYGWRRESR
jgi:hypothetical protein